MEKNTNMSSDDELCIKYVMDELDPSEKLMVERAMQEDENLLIEIECLRRTFYKVRQLPYYEPPREVSEAIVARAVEQQNRRNLYLFSSARWGSTTLMATAATLFLSFAIGIYQFLPIHDSGSAIENEEVQGAANQVQQSRIHQQIAPWLEQNSILHIPDFEFTIHNIDARETLGAGTASSDQQDQEVDEALENLRFLQQSGDNADAAIDDLEMTRSTND